MRRFSVIGFLLILLGLLLLLGSLGVLDVSVDTIWRFWPAILIYAGLVRILHYLGS